MSLDISVLDQSTSRAGAPGPFRQPPIFAACSCRGFARPAGSCSESLTTIAIWLTFEPITLANRSCQSESFTLSPSIEGTAA